MVEAAKKVFFFSGTATKGGGIVRAGPLKKDPFFAASLSSLKPEVRLMPNAVCIFRVQFLYCFSKKKFTK